MPSLADHVRPGMRIAVADGTGSPRALLAELATRAERHGDPALQLGWMPFDEPQLRPEAFADARTVMPGWGLRRHVEAATPTTSMW